MQQRTSSNPTTRGAASHAALSQALELASRLQAAIHRPAAGRRDATRQALAAPCDPQAARLIESLSQRALALDSGAATEDFTARLVLSAALSLAARVSDALGQRACALDLSLFAPHGIPDDGSADDQVAIHRFAIELVTPLLQAAQDAGLAVKHDFMPALTCEAQAA